MCFAWCRIAVRPCHFATFIAADGLMAVRPRATRDMPTSHRIRDPVQFLDLRRGYLDCAVVITAKASGSARSVLRKL